MVRWALWASPARLDEPLPPIGDNEWGHLAKEFIERYSMVSSERYTNEEAVALQLSIQGLAKNSLPKTFGFTEAEMMKMTSEELTMRWVYMQYCRFRAQIEPMAFQTPLQLITSIDRLQAQEKAVLDITRANSSPFFANFPQGILACKDFERRVKFIQTIEALRDHFSHHGSFPASLDELRLQAPMDPFTEKPFEYERQGIAARIRQADVKGLTTARYDYVLTTN